MSIYKLLRGLTNSLKDEMPATGEAARSFTEACRRADHDPREQQRISDIADLLDAEEALYADAIAAIKRGDQHTALPLLRQCAEAGTGEAHWLLGQLFEDLGHTGEAITWYQRAADDGDGRATDKLAELRASQNPDADTTDDQPQPQPAISMSHPSVANSTLPDTPVNDDVHPRRRAKAPAASAATDIALMVRRAAEGDVRAWERLVDQYAQLIWGITRQFSLAESDAADVAQTTWLRLLEHIDRIDHPERVGSWLAATARNECLRSVAARRRVVPHYDDAELDAAIAHEPEIDASLLADQRAQAVRDALTRLPRRWQRLLEMLMTDPPVSNAEISDELGLPVGSIGPTRGRCLARLRVVLQDSEASADGRTASYALRDSESHRDWEVVGELVSGRCV